MQSWNLLQIDAPGGTVDPTVLYSGEARAVLIAFEPGQALGEHEVKERAFLTVVAGEVEVDADGGTVKGGAGAFFVFDPAERHTVRSPAGARVLLLLAPWPASDHYRGG